MTFLPISSLVYLLVIQAPAASCAGIAILVAGICYMLLGGSYSAKCLKERLFKVANCVIEGIKSYGWIMAVCFGTQIIIALFSYSGLSTKFSSAIIGLRETGLMLSLILSLIVVLILGMGVPAVAAYLIGFAVIGPALTTLGVAPLQVHFFVFYASILGNITPPVCLAVYATAKLASANWLKTGVITCALTFGNIVIVPFYLVFHPALLMQGDALTIIATTVKLMLCILSFQAIWQRHYLLRYVNILDCVLLAVAGCFFLLPGWFPIIGVILMLLTFLSQKYEFPFIPYISYRFN